MRSKTADGAIPTRRGDPRRCRHDADAREVQVEVEFHPGEQRRGARRGKAAGEDDGVAAGQRRPERRPDAREFLLAQLGAGFQVVPVLAAFPVAHRQRQAGLAGDETRSR